MNINGTSGNDILPGTSLDDLINAGAGDDMVDAGDGNDVVNAGNGNDNVLGGLGNDSLNGGNGNDMLGGGEGDDTLSGGNGDDMMDGGAGSDNISGGNGNDIATYVLAENTGASDLYDGGTGSDTLRLVLTGAEWAASDIRASIHGYHQSLLAGERGLFDFTGFDLSARGFEHLEVIVDGVSVTLTDDPVDAIDDSYSVLEDDMLNGDVTANDSTPDGVSGVSLIQDVTQGTLTLNGDGSFMYDTAGQFNYLAEGETAVQTFIYEVEDGTGDTDTATATITIEGVNDGPDAVDDMASVGEDGPGIIINLLGNDTDPDTSDVLSLASLDLTGLQGTVVDNGDGTVTYDPNGAFDALNDGETALDSFTYTVSDGHGGTDTATVSVEVAGDSENGFDGTTVDYTYFYPDLASVFFNTDVAAGAGVELPGIYSAFGDVGTVDFDGDKIIIDFITDSSWNPGAFNGFQVFDEFSQLSDIVDVSIESSNMAGLDNSAIAFDANTLSVHWENLSFTSDTQVVFDVDFA